MKITKTQRRPVEGFSSVYRLKTRRSTRYINVVPDDVDVLDELLQQGLVNLAALILTKNELRLRRKN